MPTFPAFLLNPEQVIFYYGKTHLAVEYAGPIQKDKLDESTIMPITFYDYTQTEDDFFESIIGFGFNDSSSGAKMILPPFTEDLVLPTDTGFDKLVDLKWNFAAQDAMIGINTGGISVEAGRFARMVNSLFFDADHDGLKTRHIKWIDFLPLSFDESDAKVDKFSINIGLLKQFVEFDAAYTYPTPPKQDYKLTKLPQLNRLIELVARPRVHETEITRFLAQKSNLFILSMAFLGQVIHPEIACHWQSEENNAIIPDFFIERSDGYADIVEFKLPSLKSGSIVGKTNRETFSAELNAHISQTRTYLKYFEDPNNRKWVKERYGFNVLYPRRILVIGRRWEFSNPEWREIAADYKDLEILTYDDIIDGVQAQFYI
jgi:hypothetical protein